jgi:biopolymer transport protein ExbD
MGMKFKSSVGNAEMDMTPMIDMTFQLITFFMMVINFRQTEVAARVDLPASQLAIPKDSNPDQEYLILHVDDEGDKVDKDGTEDDKIVFMGISYTTAELSAALSKRRREIEEKKPADGDNDPRHAKVIIRADRNAETGLVQEVIELCKKNRFEQFMLRARHDDRGMTVQ